MNENKKLQDLTIYIARRCAGYNLFGTVKLNKTLFFADTNALLRLGHSITGAAYVKLQHGPVPVGMKEMIERLEQERIAVIEEREMPNSQTQKRLVVLKSQSLREFTITAEEISIVEEVLEWIRPMTAQQVSDLSHESVGWSVARMGEEINLHTAIIPPTALALSAREEAAVLEFAKKNGLAA